MSQKRQRKRERDGGDSDDEADDFLEHDAAMVEATLEEQKMKMS
jgi:hypothetical protein